MRRITWIVAIVMSFALVLAGCGKKDAGGVVKDLNKIISKLESSEGSYQGAGRMILQSGQQPLEYAVEVWYQNPYYYRISLKNQEKDITQIVLRNDEGVFVLTPHLNKSFRFKSSWPENQRQVYLYQSLVQSIVEDNERHFTTEDNSYVFDVAASYNTGTLARQKIWLDKKSLSPQKVEVSDTSNNVVVKVEFTQFEFDKKFDKDSFDMQRNMTSFNLQSMQTMSPGKGKGDVKKPTQLELVEPTYLPKGTAIQNVSETKYGEQNAYQLRYVGKYNYNLLEFAPRESAATSMLAGDVVDLGITLGVITGSDTRTLAWTYNGYEYRMTSADLPVSEMVKVAQSMQGPAEK
jgi:outer membrane lipoprotein-sorting protein